MISQCRATQLLNSFCEYCIANKQYPVYQLFSAFEKNLSHDDLRYVDDNYLLFVEAGGAARLAQPPVLEELRKLSNQ